MLLSHPMEMKYHVIESVRLETCGRIQKMKLEEEVLSKHRVRSKCEDTRLELELRNQG